MKNIKLTILYLLMILNISCGVCFPSNLEFKNIKYFDKSLLQNIDLNTVYRETKSYEATKDLKRIYSNSSVSNIDLKFSSDGFVYADLWNWNDKKQQGIIYSKNGALFLDRIGSTQDRCRYVEAYRVLIEGDKIILIKYGGITDQKQVFEFTKIQK